jgi:hypothetical protein
MAGGGGGDPGVYGDDALYDTAGAEAAGGGQATYDTAQASQLPLTSAYFRFNLFLFEDV